MYENIRILINDFSSHADAKKQKNYLAIKPASDIKKTTSPHFDNIIIIAIESLDENYLHSVNQDIPEECTKNIDKIRNTSVHFSNYFTSAQPTVYGLHAILTSRLDYSNDGEEIPSLFDVLKEYDFETFYFNGVSGYYGGEGKRFQNRYRPSFNYFSEHFEKKYGVKSKGWGINSELLFHEAIDLLNNNITKRKFIVISTIDTHPPYGELPPMGDVCMKNTQITNSPFLLSLCALDRKIAFFASKISEIKSPTLLIITADHSATHGENYTKRDNFDPDRIPLIFMSNTETTSFFPTTHNTNFCSQIDLAPTILNFCSITPPESFRGRIITEQNKSYSKISNSIVIIRDEEKSALATTNGLEQ